MKVVIFKKLLKRPTFVNEMIKFDGESNCERRQCFNASYGTLRTVTSMTPSDEDPWAIVDLVDNSEKWAGTSF